MQYPAAGFNTFKNKLYSLDASVIDQSDVDLAAIPRIEDARRVDEADAMTCCQARTGHDQPDEARRNRDSDTGGDQKALSRCQFTTSAGIEVNPGVSRPRVLRRG